MIIRRITGWPTWELRSPFEELERMRSQMNRFAEELTEGLYREPTAGVFPLLNVTEDKDKYYVRAELPGIKANDLDISVMGNTLSISAANHFRSGRSRSAPLLLLMVSPSSATCGCAPPLPPWRRRACSPSSRSLPRGRAGPPPSCECGPRGG